MSVQKLLLKTEKTSRRKREREF